jgi:acetolactate decarboxylase
MVSVVSNDQAKQSGSSSWCVKWFGSQKDFIAGNVREPVPLKRLAGLENLYAVGPLENARGEISIFNSVPMISQVKDRGLTIVTGLSYRAGFLAFAIVENWCKSAILKPADSEQRFAEQLLPLALSNGIDINRPFPFLLHGQVERATLHVLCNQSDEKYRAELHEKAKVRFAIQQDSVEIIGFYSKNHRGIFTPGDSDFHMHARTVDNRLSGHLEEFNWEQGVVLYLPIDASHHT